MSDFVDGSNERVNKTVGSRKFSDNLLNEFAEGSSNTSKSLRSASKNSNSRRKAAKRDKAISETNMIELQAEDERTEPVFQDPALPLPDLNQRETFSTKMRVESQMGKGIIRPHSVEIGVDGFHFKYDEPKKEISKPEQFIARTSELSVNAIKVPAQEIKTQLESEIISEEICPAAEAAAPLYIAEADEALTEEIFFDSAAENEDDLGEIIIEDFLRAEEPKKELEPEQSLFNEFIEDWNKPEEPPLELYEELFEKSEVEISEEILNSLLESEVLWSGNEMRWGIPIGKNYQLTTKVLIIKESLMIKSLTVPVQSITNVELSQSWFGKLFGVGDIKLKLTDFSFPQLTMKKIAKPQLLYQLIGDLIKSN